MESFYHHLLNVVPGTSANYVHYQAYFVDGICRWNAMRKDPSIGSLMSEVGSFDFELTGRFNQLHVEIFGTPFDIKTLPNKYTGEAIGIEFLFNQTNQSFSETYIADNIDNGCSVEEEDPEMSSQDHSIFKKIEENECEGREVMEQEDNEDEHDDWSRFI